MFQIINNDRNIVGYGPLSYLHGQTRN